MNDVALLAALLFLAATLYTAVGHGGASRSCWSSPR